MNLRPVTTARGHVDSVNALALSDRLLASGGEDGNVYLWSLSSSPYPILSVPRSEPCSDLKFSFEKPNILYSSHSNYVFSWDVRYINSPLDQWSVSDYF